MLSFYVFRFLALDILVFGCSVSFQGEVSLFRDILIFTITINYEVLILLIN
jgi:hypothetical protein